MDNLNSGGYSFETEKSISGEDDEMAAFEAECAKMLEQEHQRLAEEEKEREIAEAAEAVRAVAMPVLSFESKPAAEPEVTSESEPEAVPESEDVPEVKSLPEPEEEKLPEENTENESESEPESEEKPESQNQVLRDELAAIMKAESEELVLHSAAAETQTQDGETENKSDDSDDASDESIPKWLRILFTLLLLLLGGLGVYVMVGMDYGSTVFDPLCFIEIAICTLTAVGINASHIQFRVGKEMIMRLAAYSLFVFYVVYSADCLFLKRLLAYGIDKENIVGYAKTHISLDVVNGLTAMGNSGMFGCALFVLPIAFMLLVLFKPFRNLILYLFSIAIMYVAVSTVRIATMSGSFDLSQGCMVITGAAAAYIIFAFPPLKRMITDAGLILWEYNDDDYDE